MRHANQQVCAIKALRADLLQKMLDAKFAPGGAGAREAVCKRFACRVKRSKQDLNLTMRFPAFRKRHKTFVQ